MMLQIVGFDTIGRSPAWLAVFMAFGSVPALVVVLLGIAIGTAITWLGWIIPSARARAPRGAAAA